MTPVTPVTRAAALTAALAMLLSACGATSAPAPRSSTRPASVAAAPVTSSTSPSTTPAATPTATPNPCARNRSGKVVRVSIERQHLWMCDATRLVRDTPVTSGMSGRYTETPRGHYRVQARTRHAHLTLNTGKTYDVQYWIPFDAPLFGFHDAPWQHFAYGSAQYRTRGSHGCVHMPRAAIAYLYRWADVGTRVTIT